MTTNYDTIVVSGEKMSSEFLDKIEDDLKVSLFTDDDLKLIFRDKESSAIYNSLTYHLKLKNLERFKRGLYALTPRRKEKYTFSKFKLANKLVLHSFISFESALSHHNLIPETVHETTSSTNSKNVMFENSFGKFSFTYSPVEPFYLGVEKDKASDARVANPIRALFDIIYVRKKHYSKSLDLEQDLRIDLIELKKILSHLKAADILELGEAYKKKTTRNFAKLLIKELM